MDQAQSSVGKYYLSLQTLDPLTVGAKAATNNTTIVSKNFLYTPLAIFFAILIGGTLLMLVLRIRDAKKFVQLAMLSIFAAILPVSMLVLANPTSLVTKANSGHIPENVAITNRSSSGFTVTWQTKKETVGGIRINSKSGSQLPIVEFENTKSYSHSHVIPNLTADTTYELTIFSDGQAFGHGNKPIVIVTSNNK